MNLWYKVLWAILGKIWKVAWRQKLWKVLVDMLVPIIFFAILAWARTHFTGFSRTNASVSKTDVMNMETLKSFMPPRDEWELWNAPSEEIHSIIVSRVASMINMDADVVYNFETNYVLFEQLKKYNGEKTIFAVTFEEKIDKNFVYNISVHNKYLNWNTDKIYYDKGARSKIGGYNPYLHQGFVALQILFNRAFIEIVTGDSQNMTITLQEIPYPADEVDDGLEYFFSTILPLITMLTISFVIFMSVQLNMRRDQSAGMNDLLVANGVKMWIILLGWFIYHTFILVLTLIPVVLILTITKWGSSHTPIQYCSVFVLYVFLLLYSLANVSFFLFWACVARSSTITYMVAVIISLVTCFISLTTISESETSFSIATQMIMSIFFINASLRFGFKAIEKCEFQKTSCSLSIFNEGNNIELGQIFICLTVYIILANLGSLCINKLHSMDRQTLELCWRKLFHNSIDNSLDEEQGLMEETRTSRNLNVEERRNNLYTDENPSSSTRQEDIPLSDNRTSRKSSGAEEKKHSFISIRNLKKKYGVRVALNIPTLDIPKREVTAILGMNGAGKTTLLSILSGSLRSFEGSVDFQEKNKGKALIGYCAQADILFDDLTVEEHMQFFAKIRNVTSNEKGGTVIDLLNALSLDTKKDKYAMKLRCGDKRKLCLAMALLGHPELIILDEIICACDLKTRNKIRFVLEESNQKGSTIITTTHAIDEVVLPNHVVILHKGENIFDGNTSELRNTNGQNGENNGDKAKRYISIVTEKMQDLTTTRNQIESNLGEAVILQREGRRFVLQAPGDQEGCRRFIEILEAYKKEWKIQSISYNVNALSTFVIEKIKQEDPHYKSDAGKFNFSEMETHLRKLTTIFENRDNGYKLSVLQKRGFFFLKNFYHNIPGFLILMLFASFAVYFTTEGRSYYKGQELPLKLNLDLLENKTFFLSGQSKNPLMERVMNRFNGIVMETRKNFSTINLQFEVNEEVALRYQNKSKLFEKEVVFGADFSIDQNSNISVNILYSPVYIHSAPISINLAMNAILQGIQNEEYSIGTTNIPTAKEQTYFVHNELKDEKVFLMWTIFITAGMMFMFGDYLFFPYIDISTNYIKFQVSSAARATWYWMLNLLFDILHSGIQILILISFILLLDNALSSTPLLKIDEIVIFGIILLVTGTSKLPLCYFFGFLGWKQRLDESYSQFIYFGIVTGLIPSLIISAIDPSDYTNNLIIFFFISPFPHLAANFYLIQFGKKFVENYNWDHLNPNIKQFVCRTNSNPCCFAESLECIEHRSYFYNKRFGLSYSLVLPLIALVFWQCVLISIYFTRPTKKSTSEIMEGINIEPNTIYGIDNKMIQKIDLQNSVQDQTIRSKGKVGLHGIGYFPENNQMRYWINGLDLLILAGLTRGFSYAKSTEAANLLIDIFDLRQLANVKCANYSGGNKKRLQICIAFMGFPNFVKIHNASKALDITINQEIWDFYLGYKEYTHKSVILGIINMNRYRAVCDKLLPDNLPKSSGGQPENEKGTKRPSHIVKFRTESATPEPDFKNFIAGKIKENLGFIIRFPGVQTENDNSMENRSRLINIEIIPENEQPTSVCKLFDWASDVEKDKTIDIEGFAIDEII